MPTNIEIKARVEDFEAMKARAESLGDKILEVIPQEDTFFNTEKGRLKLRVFAPDRGQLIYYERPDSGGPKRSDYYLTETSNPDNLKTTLSMALGIRAVVKKTRHLYISGQTRIHLDDVEGLGHFMELEVVLTPGQSEAEGQAIAEEMMHTLGIRKETLIEGAYVDLLESH
ncbi:MAG: class IV adenylate cyclase [Anaerolineae bacterium]|nr:class IV adenylate cyclase [Anaerolineae bacterium]MDK1080720.1 class IV adenylate cyclase [Anaerolineae bacterium]MDK1117523.1 class IV adenylate cyclase [Anaerolineae bacterium]